MNTKISNPDVDQLIEILSKNKPVWDVISSAESLNLPECYVGAGCIAQSVWNYYHNFELTSFINDIDLVYFDVHDMSFEKENETIRRVNDLFTDIPIKIDVKNQARVHLWYKEHFGYDISPYNSIEDAVASWPTTSTSIAIKFADNTHNIIAPFGLKDLFNMIIHPNKKQITEKIYNTKVNRWRQHWPNLKIVSW